MSNDYASRDNWVMCLFDMCSEIGFAFCSIDCFRRWGLFLDWDFGRYEIRWTNDVTCMHCYVCGGIVRISPNCEIHDGSCPEKNFDATFAAHRLGSFIHRSLKRPLEDADIAVLQEVMRDRREGESTDLLAARVLERLRTSDGDPD
jgi:hypothetical protein